MIATRSGQYGRAPATYLDCRLVHAVLGTCEPGCPLGGASGIGFSPAPVRGSPALTEFCPSPAVDHRRLDTPPGRQSRLPA